jgi:hypothetical protein
MLGDYSLRQERVKGPERNLTISTLTLFKPRSDNLLHIKHHTAVNNSLDKLS